MKLKPATLRTFTNLHSWVGLVAGFALFVAFYAGAITVFQPDVQRWANPHATPSTATLADAQQLLDDVLAQHPEARDHVGMTFPATSWRSRWPTGRTATAPGCLPRPATSPAAPPHPASRRCPS